MPGYSIYLAMIAITQQIIEQQTVSVMERTPEHRLTFQLETYRVLRCFNLKQASVAEA